MARLKNINSLREKADHVFDVYTSMGYQYEGQILKKVISPEMFANPIHDRSMFQIQRLVEYLINAAKKIKLHYALALPKNSKLVN